MTTTRLSYSQIRLYGECGQKYKYSYIDKLREKTKSGALLFGTAIDKALEAVVTDPNVDEKAVFDTVFTTQDINRRMVHVPDCLLVVYSASDFDSDLLAEDDVRFLDAKLTELIPEMLDLEDFAGMDRGVGLVKAAVAKCAVYKKQRAFRKMREGEMKFYNLANWLCLRRKGHMMLDAHRERILPKLTVHGAQVKIELKNAEGDTLLGYVDLNATWEGDTEPTIWDYKTSSIEYDADSVVTSPQLTIYSHALNVRKAGYIVFRKGILKNKVKVCSICGMVGTGSRAKTCTNEVTGKRCAGSWNETIKPEVDIQVITAIIPERTEEIVLDNIEMTNKAIKAGIFPRNFNSCQQGYGPCPYLRKCFHNDDSDLEQQ